jgi:hypothetical protein
MANTPQDPQPDIVADDAIDDEAAERLPTREVMSIINPSGGAMFGPPHDPGDPPMSTDPGDASTDQGIDEQNP